eukprot:6657748-Pyramimonas_sp.AAC.1
MFWCRGILPARLNKVPEAPDWNEPQTIFDVDMNVAVPEFESYTSIVGTPVQACRAYLDGSVNSADGRVARGDSWTLRFHWRPTNGSECRACGALLLPPLHPGAPRDLD